MKDKDLNDRVKNQIRLMLSSASSSDTSSVVNVFEKSGKNPDSYEKTSNKLEVKEDGKFKTKKQNGITNSDFNKEPGCSSKKSTKPSSPKKSPNSSKKPCDLLSKSVTDNSSDLLSSSVSKTDRKTTPGINKRPSISTKSTKTAVNSKRKNKQVCTKTVVSEKEKMKKKSN